MANKTEQLNIEFRNVRWRKREGSPLAADHEDEPNVNDKLGASVRSKSVRADKRVAARIKAITDQLH